MDVDTSWVSVHWPHAVPAGLCSAEVKTGYGLIDSLLPRSLSSANRFNCMKDWMNDEGGKLIH